jgi:hypothetical protein
MCDTALSKGSVVGSAAAVARDDNGMFLEASVVVMSGITDPEQLEALACQKSMSLASDLGI